MQPYVTAETLAARSSAWLQRVAPYNRAQLQLQPGRAALLVVDMQRFFLDPLSPTYTCGGTAILPGLKRLVAAFRALRRPVIFTRHVHHPSLCDAGIMGWWWEGMCLEGSTESEIVSELSPLPGEKQVFKHRYSAFYNTDLETVLRCWDIADLVICGVMTNLCCESTARDAYFRDLRVFLPADGCGAVNEELHLASLLNLSYGFASITSVERLLAELTQAADKSASAP